MSSTLASFTVHCPSCEASFPVDPAKVPDGGIYAICSECDRTFLVSHPEATDEPGGVVEAPEAPTFGEEELVFDAPAVEDEEVGVEGEVVAADDGAGLELKEDEVFEFSEEEPEAEAGAAPPEPGALREEEAPPAAFEDLRGLASEAQSEGPSTHTGGSTLSEGAQKFGRRDPEDRAQRLARVLVSDIIAYYPERFQESRARGTVKEDFESEVEKSWKEYVDQVGEEMAESTPYFTEALNEILAGGEEVF